MPEEAWDVFDAVAPAEADVPPAAPSGARTVRSTLSATSAPDWGIFGTAAPPQAQQQLHAQQLCLWNTLLGSHSHELRHMNMNMIVCAPPVAVCALWRTDYSWDYSASEPHMMPQSLVLTTTEVVYALHRGTLRGQARC